eukprot:73219_1
MATSLESDHDFNILLVSGYSRDTHNGATLIDITNIICSYLRIIFDFEIISEKYRNDKVQLYMGGIGISADGVHMGYSIESTDVVYIVISINSGCIKAGFAGSDYPILAIPNIVAPQRNNTLLIGREAYDASNATITSPIQNGDIHDWNAIKHMLCTIVQKINDKNNLAVLVTECIDSSKGSRERMAQFMFEELNVFAFFILPRAVLALYAAGRTTGCVVLSDYHCTEIVPIHEGYVLRGKERKIKVGRRNVLRYLERNKKKLKSDNDAFKILFEPRLCEMEEETTYEHDGIHAVIHECIGQCDADMRRDMYCNIVLAGINTIDLEDSVNVGNENGFATRLETKLKGLQGSCGHRVKIIASPDRGDLPWIGGSILASLSTFESLWMRRQHYQKHGASIVHKKSLMEPDDD